MRGRAASSGLNFKLRHCLRPGTHSFRRGSGIRRNCRPSCVDFVVRRNKRWQAPLKFMAAIQRSAGSLYIAFMRSSAVRLEFICGREHIGGTEAKELPQEQGETSMTAVCTENLIRID